MRHAASQEQLSVAMSQAIVKSLCNDGVPKTISNDKRQKLPNPDLCFLDGQSTQPTDRPVGAHPAFSSRVASPSNVAWWRGTKKGTAGGESAPD